MIKNNVISMLFLVVFLTGCSDTNQTNLDAFIKNAEKSAQGESIEPLPELKVYKPYQFEPDKGRTPFSLAKQASVQQIPTQGIELPDRDHQKGPLEQYPLSQLNLVGIVKQKDQYWGLVLSGDHRIVHVVKAGEYIGSDHGKIKKITQNKMVVREIKKTMSGSWIEKDVTLTVSTDDKNAPSQN